MADDPIQGSPRAFRSSSVLPVREVVGEVLGQRDGLVRLRVDLEHHPRAVFAPGGLKEEAHSVSVWSMPHANPMPLVLVR